MGFSSGAKRRASTATISGIVAMRIEASDEDTCVSPTAMRKNGTAISQTA